MKRFASPVILDKEPSIAYITVKESIEAGHRVYSLELFEIEKFGGKIQRLIEDKHSVAPNTIFSLNKKIDDVNNCSKVVQGKRKLFLDVKHFFEVFSFTTCF